MLLNWGVRIRIVLSTLDQRFLIGQAVAQVAAELRAKEAFDCSPIGSLFRKTPQSLHQTAPVLAQAVDAILE